MSQVKEDTKYQGVGAFYEKAGRLEQAIEYYKKYFSAKPEADWARIYLGRAYIRAERWEELRELIERNPKALVYYQCHWPYFEKRQYQKAAGMVDRALELYEDGSIKEDRGRLEKRLNRIRNQERLEEHWSQYLSQIQKDGDYENWKGKPYDLHMRRNPTSAR